MSVNNKYENKPFYISNEAKFIDSLTSHSQNSTLNLYQKT